MWPAKQTSAAFWRLRPVIYPKPTLFVANSYQEFCNSFQRIRIRFCCLSFCTWWSIFEQRCSYLPSAHLCFHTISRALLHWSRFSQECRFNAAQTFQNSFTFQCFARAYDVCIQKGSHWLSGSKSSIHLSKYNWAAKTSPKGKRPRENKTWPHLCAV